MFNVSQTAKRMLWIIFALYILACIGGCVYYNDSAKAFGFVLGLWLGTALSAARGVMLERAIGRSLDMEKEYAGRYATLMYTLRFFITALVLTAAALISFINLWGTIIGLLLLQVSAYVVNILFKDKE